MNNKLTKQVFGINKDHIVVMVEDKTWRSSQQTRMTLGRAAYVLHELGVDASSIDTDENESHEGWLARTKNLLSNPLTIAGKTFYIPQAPETTHIDPQWNWQETNPAWFEAKCDGKVYAVGLETFTLDHNAKDVGGELLLRGSRWMAYWYREEETGGKTCIPIMHQPRFARLVEAQAWIEDLHERGKDKSGIVGG